MKLRYRSSLTLALAAAIAIAAASGCGGVATSGPPPPPPPPPPPLVISTKTLPPVLQGQSYTQTLQASGGTPPYSWSVVPGKGSFPPGMALSSSGILSGTATQAGGYFLVVEVTDSGFPAQAVIGGILLNIPAILSITPQTLPADESTMNVGQRIFQQLLVNGGTGPFTWGLQSAPGSIPPGWSVTTAPFTGNGLIGILGGSATKAGLYTFTVQVSDPGPPAQTATQSYTVTITNNLTIVNQGVIMAVVSKPFHATLTVLGGVPPYTWTVNPNSDPPWLTLNPSTGEISGTPPQHTAYGLVVDVTDSSPGSQPVQGNFVISVQPQLAFIGTVLNDFVVGQFYPDVCLPFEGGIPPYTEQVVSGTLPPGISLDQYCLSGAPTAAGNYNIVVQISDTESPPAVIQQSFSLRVHPLLQLQPSGNDLPNGLEGQPYSFTFQATGGLPPLTWSVSFTPAFPFQAQPSGLSIDPNTGILSGTPTAAFQGVVDVVAVDSGTPPQSGRAVSNLFILGKLRLVTSELPLVAANSSMSLQVAATGGIGQYTWTQVSGQLPPGLVFNPTTAIVSGQTAQTGTFPITLQVSDPGPPAQTSGPVPLQLTVGTDLGRNDSPATATPLSNGTYRASISPFSDPPTGVANPDTDYYRLTANPGATVTIETTAQRLNPPSPLDSVLEIVDASGNRISLCSSDPVNTVGPFDQTCLNDDITLGVLRDSKLNLQVPSSNTGPLTFYAHVLDWRGSARPDFIYTITISGAN